jgi:ABC-type uncharacterized transport system involved in gliding motility auxiliary subunit
MKDFKSYKKYLKYVALFGLILTIVGLTTGIISGSWSIIPVGLTAAGGIIIVAALGTWLEVGQNFFGKRSTQVGTNAIVATVAVVAILGLVNFLAVENGASIDLTENKILTLAPESQEIVRNLDQPLKVWIFQRVPNPLDRNLLEKYSRYSDNFSYEYVNPEQEIGLAQEFGVRTAGEVYIELGEKRQQVQIISELEPLSEIRLTNAIQQVQSNRTAQVYFLQGHGEAVLTEAEGGMSEAVTALKGKGYEVSPLTLAEAQEFPTEADVIVLANPQRELFPKEVEALQDYLEEGGNLLVTLNPDSNSGLDPIFQEWGVNLTDLIIIDGSGSGNVIGLGPATPIVTNYGNHPITRNFANGISFYPLSQPVKSKEVKEIEATPLAITNQQSWGESNIEAEEVAFNPESDTQGPLNVGMAFRRTDTEEESRLVVFGNNTFATDGWFSQQLNGDIFLNSGGWLSQDDNQLLSIRPRQPENRRILLTPTLAGLLSWLALVVFPGFGLIAALVMWWRRR